MVEPNNPLPPHLEKPCMDGLPPSLHIAAGMATITLRRPSRRNSLQDADLRELLDQFSRIEADPEVRLLVLTAVTTAQKRPVFCAGYDVAGFDGGEHDPRLFEQVADTLARLRPITVCALSGSVYGGATDLVLACDLVLAVSGAEFLMPAAALGLHYYPSGLQRYVSRLGVALAKRAFLSAKPLSIETLYAAGAVAQLSSPEAFQSMVDTWSAALALLAPLAVQATKRSLNELAEGKFDLAALRAREQSSRQSLDFAEGRAAFAARRKPRFTGH